MNEEHQVQRACVTWFRIQYPELRRMLFAVPNGSRRTVWEQRQAMEEGMVSGVADLVLSVPRGGYGALFIEMKKESEVWKGGKRTVTRGYQSKAQKEWQADAERHGNRYVVCHSLDEFMTAVNGYLRDGNGARPIVKAG